MSRSGPAAARARAALTAKAMSTNRTDGTPYGQAIEPQTLDVQAKLFSALRNMGFKEGQVRAVLAELRRDDALRGVSIQAAGGETARRNANG